MLAVIQWWEICGEMWRSQSASRRVHRRAFCARGRSQRRGRWYGEGEWYRERDILQYKQARPSERAVQQWRIQLKVSGLCGAKGEDKMTRNTTIDDDRPEGPSSCSDDGLAELRRSLGTLRGS